MSTCEQAGTKYACGKCDACQQYRISVKTPTNGGQHLQRKESRSETIAGVAFMVGLVAIIVGIGIAAGASVALLIILGGIGLLAGRPAQKR